ncbi:hypothetical protein NDU88_004354 [Pleurodeles waltl]|uniref:Uncharacterized protein n=1 Tax=Pleurodeles waltl TaxID=8319 RepID=A0AAV7MT86_PLEWA|nr:hypothetical protein NDU88_004354 [Pleurodeles waltl]
MESKVSDKKVMAMAVDARKEKRGVQMRTLRKFKKQVSRQTKKVAKEARWDKDKNPDETRLLRLRSQYKKDCWTEKGRYYEDLWSKLLISNKQKNNKKFWQLVNGLVQGQNQHSNAGIDADTLEAHVLALYSSSDQKVKSEDSPAVSHGTSSSANFGFRMKLTDTSQLHLVQDHALMDIDIEQLIGIIKKLKQKEPQARVESQKAFLEEMHHIGLTLWCFFLTTSTAQSACQTLEKATSSIRFTRLVILLHH